MGEWEWVSGKEEWESGREEWDCTRLGLEVGVGE